MSSSLDEGRILGLLVSVLVVVVAFNGISLSTYSTPPSTGPADVTTTQTCSDCTHRVWTDKDKYQPGEVVVVHIDPPVGGVGYGLFVIKPDGSNVTLHLNPRVETGNATYTIIASDPAGQYRVELWGRVIYPGAPRTLRAYCTFTVQQPQQPPEPVRDFFSKLWHWLECLIYGNC